MYYESIILYGDKHNVTDCKPISKMSIISITAESLITTHVMSPYIVCPNQYGCRPVVSKTFSHRDTLLLVIIIHGIL